jgi:hypothetical protein
MKHKIVLAGLSLALSWPPLALAQSKLQLQLPSGEETYREMQQEQRSGPCERCGVVFRTRTESRAGPGRRDPAMAARQNLGSPDDHMATAPIIGSGSSVRDARKAAAPVVIHIVTVRYDDGSFAAFEQLDEPVVREGDRVRVVDGRVELRND